MDRDKYRIEEFGKNYRIVPVEEEDVRDIEASGRLNGHLTVDQYRKLHGLTPEDQAHIDALEGEHVSLADFQRLHGLDPDGVMGPATKKVIEELEYKRQNEAEIDRLVEMVSNEPTNHFADTFVKMVSRRKVCDAHAHMRLTNGLEFHARCDKGTHEDDTMHGASFGHQRVRWNDMTGGDGFFLVDTFGEWVQVNQGVYKKGVSYSDAFRQTLPHFSISRPEEFVEIRPDEPVDATQLADHVIRNIDYLAQQGLAKGTEATKVIGTSATGQSYDVEALAVKRAQSAEARAKSYAAGEKMTREKYRTTFEEMQYTVVKSLYWGYRAVVTLARGGVWTCWAPTRSMAESVASKRLKRELTRLTLMFERDNPEGIGAKALGIHFPMTTDEVTEMLAKSDAEERNRAQAEWDAEFEKGDDTPGTGV